MKRELYKARGYNKEELVTDTLEQLRAFKNCDQFVTVEFEDLHDIAGGFPRGLSIQTTTDLKDLKSDNYICSTIKQTRSLNKQKIYINELQQLDFYLGFLFEYIEKIITTMNMLFLCSQTTEPHSWLMTPSLQFANSE